MHLPEADSARLPPLPSGERAGVGVSSPDSLRATQALDQALKNVPYYDPGAGHPIKERYEALPHLTKRDIRTFRDGRVDNIGDINPAFFVHQSEYEYQI